MKPSESLKAKIDLLPDSPGVYLYYDKAGTVIYVGKAKRLHRRVSSYFNREHSVLRTNVLVRNIFDLSYVVVNTEEEALHLENSLIKEYKPRYNVLLKDDKSYPWICLTNELFPRVFLTRTLTKKGGRYFGPFSNVAMARTVISLIRELYPIRTCILPITNDSIEKHKHKVCLQYHIKNCEGCCVGYVSPDKYGEYVDQIKQILNGNLQQLSDYLKMQMSQLSEQLRFEEAEEVKRKFLLLENYKSKSVIVSTFIHNVDVFSYIDDDKCAYVNYLHVRNGSINRCVTIEYRKKLDESKEEILSMAMSEFKIRFDSDAKEAIVPFMPDSEFIGKNLLVPKIGDKKKLLDISEKNAHQYLIDKLATADKLNPEQRVMRVLKRMQSDFRLTELPRHIECFDNSNIQGTNPVASCVVFRNAKPSKRDYRHFNIKTVVGPDDFASMKEVLTRRYTRLITEGESLPQLVVVDGGKGQLSAAVEAFDAMGIRGKVALIGIAKRLEEIYFPGDSLPLYIDKNSESLKVIQHLRDEAHRFGITHHRNRRSKSQTLSLLDEIKGVGTVTRETLLRSFKSLKRIKEASLQDLAEVVGISKANIVYKALKNEEYENSNTESN